MDIDIFALLLNIIPLVFAITVHEAAHALAAYKLGDNTAYMLGRVSLSPSRHIDLIGTVLVPIGLLIMTQGTMVFGWAKPVPINYSNFKNYKRDVCITAAAGPLSNVIQMIIWGLILVIVMKFDYPAIANREPSIAYVLFQMAQFGVLINILLAVFNMMPIPPLDGSRIVSMLLPYKYSQPYSKLEPYGFFIIIGLVYTQILPIGRISAEIASFYLKFLITLFF